MDIFVSYTIRDGIMNAAVLRRVEETLSRAGEPFIDALHNRAVCPQREVELALNRAAVLCVCWTPAFPLSRWACWELSLALRRQKPVVWVDLSAGNIDDDVGWCEAVRHIQNLARYPNLESEIPFASTHSRRLIYAQKSRTRYETQTVAHADRGIMRRSPLLLRSSWKPLLLRSA